MTQTRRQFVRGASAAGAAATLGLRLAPPAHASIPPGRLPAKAPASPATLREAGAARGILVGSAVSMDPLRNSPEYAALLRAQCAILMAEDAMKFGPLRPTPDQFFFDDADFLVNFAEANGMKMRGHAFAWHRQLPRWFHSVATPQNAEQLLVEHIEHVAGRYAGRIHSWDVCNEAILLDDRQPGGLRNSAWFRLLGPDYLDIAFRAARRADPHALLCYNDYSLESEAPDNAARRVAVLNLLRGLQARGVPIDALGVQGHLTVGPSPNFTYGPSLATFLPEVQSMGLQIMLTEVDVNDRLLSADIPARDAAVAALYGSFLQTAFANPAVCACLTWGLTDKYTWLNGEFNRPDRLPERCLPFGPDLKPVPACATMLEALRTAPPRMQPGRPERPSASIPHGSVSGGTAQAIRTEAV